MTYLLWSIYIVGVIIGYIIYGYENKDKIKEKYYQDTSFWYTLGWPGMVIFLIGAGILFCMLFPIVWLHEKMLKLGPYLIDKWNNR